MRHTDVSLTERLDRAKAALDKAPGPTAVEVLSRVCTSIDAHQLHLDEMAHRSSETLRRDILDIQLAPSHDGVVLTTRSGRRFRLTVEALHD